MRLYYKPLVLLIWLGAVVMVVGGGSVALGSPPARGRAEAGAGAGLRWRQQSDACGGSSSLGDARARRFAARVEAVQPDEILADAALEGRARALSKELRCMVCQNQSIDDSDAPLARDLRVLVRERLQAGDSDRQVIDFLVARYGEFVLLKPRFSLHTALLWLGPLAVLLIGAFGPACLHVATARCRCACAAGNAHARRKARLAILSPDREHKLLGDFLFCLLLRRGGRGDAIIRRSQSGAKNSILK